MKRTATRRDAYATKLRKVFPFDLVSALEQTAELTGIRLERVAEQSAREGLATLKEEEYQGLIKLNSRIGKVVHERDLRSEPEPVREPEPRRILRPVGTSSQASEGGEREESDLGFTGHHNDGPGDAIERPGRGPEATEDFAVPSSDPRIRNGEETASGLVLEEGAAPGVAPGLSDEFPL